MAEGWIKLSRQIEDHWLWNKQPYSWGQAWIDLILLANHKDEIIPYKGSLITCKRGDVNRSISFLAKRWKWNRKTVQNFLKLLASDGMVTVNATTHRTTITLVNYDNFQLQGSTKRTTNRTTKSQQDGQPSRTFKNDKNDKNIYLDIVGHLNQTIGSNYKPDSKKTQSLIDARIREGFTVDDFKTVINKKAAQWLNDPKMSTYLRPETLFGTKFEGYLNEGGSRNDTGTESILSKPEYHIPSIHEDGTYW